MAQKVNLAPLMDLSKVASAYSGQTGCMCGCLGDYAYASDYRDQAGKDRGYALSDNDVSDRKLKMRFNRLLKLVANGDYDDLDVYDFGVFVRRNDRTVAVYFKKD